MRMVFVLGAAIGIAAIVGLVVQQQPVASKSSSLATAEPQAKAPQEPARTAETPALRGEVREAIDVAEYTYLRLSTATGEVWAAVSKASIAVGSTVAITNAARMENFKSSTLGRTFDVIYFGNLQGSDMAAATLTKGHPGTAEQVPQLKVTRAKGNNARVLAELYAERTKLSGQTVRVRGQVVKVTPGIQGKNYFRIRDGSSTAPEERELVITSQLEPKRGDVATFEGILRTDVDVGIGFKYPALLENATIVPEP